MQYLVRTTLALSLLTACTTAQGQQPAQNFAPVAAQSVPEVPRKNDKPDFNGVWVMASYDLVWLPQEHDPPYTPEIKAEMERFRTRFDPKVDDPAQLCVRMGMPWRMLNRARDYPVEIYQNPDRIIMLVEREVGWRHPGHHHVEPHRAQHHQPAAALRIGGNHRTLDAEEASGVRRCGRYRHHDD